jgi:pyruvate/2-oxoglutarate dehydrogenase complex dihydrolipoamide acyltransferase (E2) component
MSLRYVKIRPLKKTPSWRKLALGTWRRPADPEIYGTLEIDLTRAYAWREKHAGVEPKVTVLHMVARAVALAMEKFPDLNGFVRFRRIYIRDSVDMFFQVATEGEDGRADLTGVHLRELNRKSVHEIAVEMSAKVERARRKGDTDLQKTSGLMSAMPGFLVRFVLWLVAFISYTLNIRFPGIPRDSFGGCMISNVGSLGLDVAFAPLIPWSRVPLLIILGQAKPRPVVIDGRVEVREIVTLNATIDHSFCDGALLARMVKVLRDVFENPDEHFGEPAVRAS